MCPALTSSQQNCIQIEKEMLAIVFGCTRFHDYIFGLLDVEVKTDHNTLEMILKDTLLPGPSYTHYLKESPMNKKWDTLRSKFWNPWWKIDGHKPNLKYHPYWNYHDEIATHNGRGTKVIEPKSMQREMLPIIHSSHLEIEKCKHRARDPLLAGYEQRFCQQIPKKKYKRTSNATPNSKSTVGKCHRSVWTKWTYVSNSSELLLWVHWNWPTAVPCTS